MGSTFWKILGAVLLLALAAVALGAITAMNPDIKALALKMAADSHLPIWLVGMAAPIVFVFRKLFGGGSPDKLDALERDNERLKAEQARLRQEVSTLNGWREQELSKQRAEISRLQGDLDALRSRLAGVDGRIETIVETPLSAFGKSMTSEEAESEADAYLAKQGIQVIE